MKQKNGNHLGIGFCGILTIVFIILKLIGVIDWSWLWVLCPLWLSGLFLIIICIVVFLVNNRKTKW